MSSERRNATNKPLTLEERGERMRQARELRLAGKMTVATKDSVDELLRFQNGDWVVTTPHTIEFLEGFYGLPPLKPTPLVVHKDAVEWFPMRRMYKEGLVRTSPIRHVRNSEFAVAGVRTRLSSDNVKPKESSRRTPGDRRHRSK